MPFDQALKPGRLARLGASPRDRRITALCLAADGRSVALTARDLRSEAMQGDSLRDSWDLLETVEITKAAFEGHALLPVDLSRQWDDDVYRAMPDGTRVLGVLMGLRGLMKIRTPAGHVYVRGLLEIEFERIRPDQSEQPMIAAEDLGSLVSVSTGAACGVLVAGAGRTGFAVPLKEAVAQLRLTLIELPPVESKKVEPGFEPSAYDLLQQGELGVEVMASNALNEAELDLGERPMLEGVSR